MRMSDSIRNITTNGIGWSAVERFSSQGISFLIQIVLARLLTPSDYGIIGMIAVFLQVSQVFVDSGFANALIQKKECTEEDYSTVFFYNLSVSLIIYILLFVLSPFVANFYNIEIITCVLRVLSLIVIINALIIVQKTILTKKVDFKSQSKTTILSSSISGFIGVFAAYMGYGVWALVIQQLLNGLFQVLALFLIVRWTPRWNLISKESFNHVLNFGSKLLLASLISVLYKNLYTILIGKLFSAKDLGNYSRAESFAIFPSSNIGQIISRVSYPVLSRIQDNDKLLIHSYKKMIQYSSFMIFPMMIGIVSLSEPFVMTVLSPKWSGCITLLQILSLSWMLDHICLLNLNLLYVKGRTDLVLRLEVIKKSIAISLLVGTVPLGIEIMCWGLVAYSVIAVIINSYYTNRILQYGFLRQLLDYLPCFLSSVLMGIIVYLSISYFDSYFKKLFFGILIGVASYGLLSMILFRDIINNIVLVLKIKK